MHLLLKIVLKYKKGETFPKKTCSKTSKFLVLTFIDNFEYFQIRINSVDTCALLSLM